MATAAWGLWLCVAIVGAAEPGPPPGPATSVAPATTQPAPAGETYERTLAAWKALAEGLRVYLDVGPALADKALERAATSARAAALIGPPVAPLGRLLAQSQAAAQARAAGKDRLCARCGNLGEVACRAPKCYGSGKVPCPTCRALGRVRVEGAGAAAVRTCPDCGQTGDVSCEVCRGAGTVTCPTCGGRSAGDSKAQVSPEQAAALRVVIAKARWLGRGWIDLYTDGALKPAPK